MHISCPLWQFLKRGAKKRNFSLFLGEGVHWQDRDVDYCQNTFLKRILQYMGICQCITALNAMLHLTMHVLYIPPTLYFGSTCHLGFDKEVSLDFGENLSPCSLSLSHVDVWMCVILDRLGRHLWLKRQLNGGRGERTSQSIFTTSYFITLIYTAAAMYCASAYKYARSLQHL